MKGNRMTKYFSENHQRFLNIANMTDQHVRNAFVKMCNRNKDITTQDALYAQEQERRADRLQDKVIELNKDNDLLKQACLRAKKDNISLKEENQRLSSCYKIGEVLSERDKKDSKMDIDAKDRRIAYLEKLFQAKNYVFSDVPNTPENMKMIKLLKKHVNKDMYRVRWRGQYLVDGEDWRKYTDGQPLSKSKCIRVYIDNLSTHNTVEGFNLDEIGIILDGLHKVSEQSEEFIRSFDIEGENDEDVNDEKLSLQKSKVLTNYFEQMRFHIEECQQKMSEIE